MTSASRNRRSENVIVEAVVIFELTFCDVERKIFGTDFVVAAYDAALEDAPETFNGIRVNGTDYILLGCVVHRLMIVFSQAAVDAAFIGRQQTNLGRDNLANKAFRLVATDCIQNASNDITLALHRADYRGLSGRGVLAAMSTLVPMLIFVFATNETLIDLDNAAKLVRMCGQFKHGKPHADCDGIPF